MNRMLRVVREKPLFAIVAVLALFSLIFLAKMTVFAPKQAANYQTAKVERASIVSTVAASGQVLSSNNLTISTSGVSAGIGILFGWYPARKASNLSPIEALRYE